MLLNESLQLSKIRFEKKGAKILPKSYGDLDKLADFLNKTPEIKVEIGSHTDARGDDFVNLELSSQRAKAVREYLMLKSVSPDRMIARGYGETKLLNHCQNGMNCSNDLHGVNDRIEVAVIAIQGVLSQELLGSNINSASGVNTKPIIEENTFVPKAKKETRIGMSEFEKEEKIEEKNSNESLSKEEPVIESKPKQAKDQTEVLTKEVPENILEQKENTVESVENIAATKEIEERAKASIKIEKTIESEVKTAEKEEAIKEKQNETEEPIKTVVIDLGLDMAENEKKEVAKDAENTTLASSEEKVIEDKTDIKIIEKQESAEENIETTIEEEDAKMAAENSEALNYKVYIGPYKSVDNDTYYTFVELNTDIDLEYTPKGMMIVLGTYEMLSDAEKFEELATEVGAKKTEIKVFKGDEKTDLSIKKLKKMGLK